MKKIYLLCCFYLAMTVSSFPQTGINNDGTQPDPSAMLDVKSNNRGVLVPRMTAVERDAIASPAKGLLIFCTDNNQYYSNIGIPSAKNWVMMSSQWLTWGQNIYYSAGYVGIGESNPTHPLTIRTSHPAGYALRLIGPFGTFGHGAKLEFGDIGNALIQEDEDDKLQIHAAQGLRITGGIVGIGTLSPNSSARLDVESTTQGFLPPRMTTTQIYNISSPAEGLMVYNTTLKVMCLFDGTSWNVLTNRDGQSCGSITYDGKTYNSVIIGMQCWMRKNLDVGTAVLGAQDQTDNGVIEKYCYNNDVANCAVYGGLYQWDEVMDYTTTSNSNPSDRRGICPEGWHIPSDAEWCQMEVYLDATIECVSADFRGTDGGGKMKETGTTHWASPNAGATNTSNFTGLPGGYRHEYLAFGFVDLTQWGYFWSTTNSSDASFAFMRGLRFEYPNVSKQGGWKKRGFSCRCVKD
jgi:uncharacterized protein (TIGR02145 family)